MKNVYDPDNDDILEWLNQKTYVWPASDWDYYVMNGQNDELVFNLANDITCERNLFFLHSLYYFVGDYYNEGLTNKDKYKRIMMLIDMVDDHSSDGVKEWKNKSLSLLSGDLEFDPSFWLFYMFPVD